jgi:HEAT repeat protein
LAARIEEVCDIWRATTLLVRLKNTSQQPLVVPTGNPRDKNAAQAYEVYVRQGTGPWRRADWAWDSYCEQPAPRRPATRRPVARPADEDEGLVYSADHIRGLEADRPRVTLQPGEHCLAFIRANDEQDNGQPKEFKVVLRQPQAGAAGPWIGVLETPPRFAPRTLVQPAALTGALPMPEHFPRFTYASTGINWSGQESVVKALWDSNRELFDLLPIYDPADVRKEFERRMRTEKRLSVKLLLAVVAARAGSEEAGLFLLETMKDTDYRVCVNVHGALALLVSYRHPPNASPGSAPPDWVVELSMAALADNRFVTGLEEANSAAGTSFTVASCDAMDLECALCDSRYSKALPLLIQRLKTGQSGSYTASMLGWMGDQRAIPFLIEMVETAGKTAKYAKEDGLSEELSRPAYALAELKAREAVPLLLRYVEYPEIIDALGNIDDARAVPALQKLVSARGKITRDGKDVYPELGQKRLFAAKVALAGFDRDKGADRLGEMLGDQSLSVFQRGEVVIYLGRRHDPRAIPYLVKAIKTESRYQPANMTEESRNFLIEMAIRGLGEVKYKAAVEGLIECFDVDFKEKDLGKGGRATPATYRNHIARSLQATTGQPFGADKQQWLKWWQGEGKQSAELK